MRTRTIILVLLALLPISAAALWAASGFERLSKSQRSQRVQVRDDLFGDVTSRDAMVRGPIFGYYVGLDVVGGATVVALLGAAATIWLTRPARSARAGVKHA